MLTPPRNTLYPITDTNPLAGAKVAVLGDAMVDRFIWGAVDRISPEAPIPVVRVTRRSTHLGGAGNVAVNLADLGAVPFLVGRLGRDEFANAFLELASKQKVDTRFMVRSATPTTSKTRIIARTQQVVRLDEEVIEPLTDDLRREVLAQLAEARRVADVLILSDYGKGMVDQPMIDAVIDLWKGGLVLADPKPRRGIDYTGITGMTPNIAEARQLGDDSPIATDAEAERAARFLVEKYRLQHIIITRSEAGMTLYERTGGAHHLPTRAVQVADVSGAGDTVMAGFAAALAAGLPSPQAASIANLAAGVVVSKLGTASVTWPELVARHHHLEE
jgi:rfaE bifunctional protein kinase chain/domain